MKPPPKETTAEFIQLLTTNQSRLYAYVLSLLCNREQAQEVMQETNIVLWRKRDQFELGTNFGAWMLKVAYYQVLECRRKVSRQALFVVNEEFFSKLAEEAEQSSELLERQQMALQTCLARLSEKERDLVHRRYSEGSSIKVVADKIGSPVTAVKQALFRVRCRLKECVRYRMKEQQT